MFEREFIVHSKYLILILKTQGVALNRALLLCCMEKSEGFFFFSKAEQSVYMNKLKIFVLFSLTDRYCFDKINSII